MKIIPLTRGKFAFVDDADHAYLSQWLWHAVDSRRKNVPTIWHAARKSTRNGRKIYMHRTVLSRMGHPNDEVRFKDGNRLNNTRQNLIVTR